MTVKLLIVEDDPAVLVTLEATVQFGGFESGTAATGQEALQAMAGDGYGAVLLDLGLPDTDGNELLPVLRQMTAVPIIVVSGWGTEQDKIGALDLGADDFIQKPFLPGELLARIRAALRRSALREDPTASDRVPVRVGSLTLDPLDRTVSTPTDRVQLNDAEYRILARLAAHSGEVITREALLEEMYGAEAPRHNKVLDVYLSRIRTKLRRLLPDQDVISSHRGVGWSLDA
jgi:two-component system KDP operon response regulator KdpE